MTKLTQEFDSNKVKDFDALPEGDYECVIEKAETKFWDNGDEYVHVTFGIVGENGNSRKIFDSMTIRSDDPDSQLLSFGKRRFKQLLLSIGLERITDTDQILNRSLVVCVGVYTPKNGGDERNNVRKYSVRGGNAPVVPPPQVRTPVPSVPVAPSVAPVMDDPFAA